MFCKNNEYVFIAKKCIKSIGSMYINRKDFKGWVKKCNGRKVYIDRYGVGHIEAYKILRDWCKCVKEGDK